MPTATLPTTTAAPLSSQHLLLVGSLRPDLRVGRIPSCPGAESVNARNPGVRVLADAATPRETTWSTRTRLLESLPEDVRLGLRRSAVRRRFRRGQAVFRQGAPADALHVVDLGRFGSVISTTNGDAFTSEVYRPGDHFGEAGLLTGRQRQESVVALEDGMTLAVPSTAIDHVRATCPAFDRLLLDSLVRRVDALNEALVELAFLPVEQRLWRRLTVLASNSDEETACVRLTQEWLASMAGTTRPTVNRLLRNAEREGWVALRRGRITILDRHALARAAG